MTLNAFAAGRRPACLQHGARNVPANVSRFLLHTGRSAANPPATVHRTHRNHHSPQDSGGVSKHRLVPISPTFYITLPNDNCYVAADAVDRWDRQTDGRTDAAAPTQRVTYPVWKARLFISPRR